VPAEVFASIEKKRDVVTRNVTAVVEAKKLKGGRVTKVIAKNHMLVY